MIISIDFDDTFTKDPEMWSKTIKIWQDAGNKVICISARRNTFDNKRYLLDKLPEGVDIYLSYDEPKHQYAKRNRLGVSIWIDDNPHAVTGMVEPEDNKWRKI